MESARPLYEVFADLTGAGSADGDPRELLDAQGHAGLPDELVAEAVVNFADTAPVEVAEHLAPFVTAHSAVGADETAAADETAGDERWLDLLVTAPTGDGADALDDVAPDEHAGLDADPGLDLDVDFGAGAGTDVGAALDTPADAELSAGETATTDDSVDDLDPSDLDETAADDLDDLGGDAADDLDDDEPEIDDIG